MMCAQIVNRTFLHKWLTMILDVSYCPFVHKRFTNISDVRFLSVCAQTIDRYSGTKKNRKFDENQENNTYSPRARALFNAPSPPKG